MKPRLNLVTLGVADVAIARSFYERLGLTASPTSNANIAFFDVNGVVLAVFGHDALADDAATARTLQPSFRGVSLAWNVASEAEVDAVMAHAARCRAEIRKPAHKTFWGGYSGYFADPDGHLWEVAHNPFLPLDAAGRSQLPA